MAHRYWFGALLLLLSALVPADRISVVVLSVDISADVVSSFELLVYRNVAVVIFDASFSVKLTNIVLFKFFTTISRSDLRSASKTLIGVAICLSCPLQSLLHLETK